MTGLGRPLRRSQIETNLPPALWSIWSSPIFTGGVPVSGRWVSGCLKQKNVKRFKNVTNSQCPDIDSSGRMLERETSFQERSSRSNIVSNTTGTMVKHIFAYTTEDSFQSKDKGHCKGFSENTPRNHRAEPEQHSHWHW